MLDPGKHIFDLHTNGELRLQWVPRPNPIERRGQSLPHADDPEALADLFFSLVDPGIAHVGAAFINRRGRVDGWCAAHLWRLQAVQSTPGTIFVFAAELAAAGVVTFASVSSFRDDTTPRDDDVDFVRRLAILGGLFGIPLVDHLLLGSSPRFESMVRHLGEEGWPDPQDFDLGDWRIDRRRGPRAIKYRHPRTGDSWSGRGQTPSWLEREIEAGASIEDFLDPGFEL